MAESKCAKFNTWGDCIQWVEVGDTPVLTVNPEAKKCNPELAKIANEKLKIVKCNPEN